MAPSSASTPRIERAITSIIASLYATDNMTDLTVKRVRSAAEAECGLPPGFLREDAWKERSKAFIEAEALRQADELENGGLKGDNKAAKKEIKGRSSEKRSDVDAELGVEEEPQRKRVKTAAKPKRSKVVESEQEDDDESEVEPTRSKMRRPLQKRKVIESESEDSASENDDSTKAGGPNDLRFPLKKTTDNHPTKTRDESESELSSLIDENPKKPKRPVKKPSKKPQPKSPSKPKSTAVAKSASPKSSPLAPKKVDDSDSELSSLIDSDPEPKKKSAPKKGSSKTDTSSKKAPKVSKKTEENLDPKDAEIKSLQGWLVKCGVRKLWHRELASCDTQKEKIAHLKQMLKDVGMEGRYSADKARRIKEQRELMADMEAVQEFSKSYGKEAKRESRGGALQAIQDMGLDFDGDEESD
jgi:hypothetical protein